MDHKDVGKVSGPEVLCTAKFQFCPRPDRITPLKPRILSQTIPEHYPQIKERTLKYRQILSALLITFLGASLSTAAEEKAFYSPEELEKIYELSPVPKLPLDKTNAFADNEKAAAFGKILFFDKRLSCAQNVSCATCHDPQKGWSDGLATPKVFSNPHLNSGSKAVSKRRVPSLWNIGYSRWLFWDGRMDSLWSQALGPPENPIEMEGGSRLLYAHEVYNDPGLKGKYESLFGKMPNLSDLKRFPLKGCPQPSNRESAENLAWDSMTTADQTAVNRVYSNLGKSLEAFERKIVSKNSKFDSYVAGLKENKKEKPALFSGEEKRGLKLFVGAGKCVDCHSGPNFTDGGFHNLRVPSRNPDLPDDPGRYAGIAQVKGNIFNGAGSYSDDPKGPSQERLDHLKASAVNKGQFKTPGLRNTAVSGPYMHQGQVKTLREVVEYYSTLKGAVKLQGPDEGLLKATHLKDSDIDALVAFLNTLTDESANAKLGLP